MRKLRQRSEREARGVFVAEGPQAVAEALAVPGAVQEWYATAEALAGRQWPGEVAPVVVPREVLQAMAETRNPQGVVAVCRFLDVPLADVGKPMLSVLLWQIRDPGNAGTVLRSADAAGASAVLFSTESVDVYNGKCVRSAAGSLFHVPVVRGVDPQGTIPALRDAGCTVLAADGGAETELFDLLPGTGEADSLLSGPVAWVFGNEARGLAPSVAESVDLVVSIRHAGRAESLNLAAAAAVCLMTTAAAQAGRIARR